MYAAPGSPHPAAPWMPGAATAADRAASSAASPGQAALAGLLQLPHQQQPLRCSASASNTPPRLVLLLLGLPRVLAQVAALRPAGAGLHQPVYPANNLPTLLLVRAPRD
eukprot:gene6266-6504_t